MDALKISVNNLFSVLSGTSLLVVISTICLLSYVMLEFSTLETLGITSNSDTKSKTPIKHVIVISQGKRSFDNYFGSFPGANGFPKDLTVPLYPFDDYLQKFTVMAWFNTNTTFSSNAFLVNKGGFGIDTPLKNMNYGIWINSSGNIEAGFETNNGTDLFIGSNLAYNDGKWHHVIVTYDGNSTLTLFIDGIQTAMRKTGGAIPERGNTLPIRIGSNHLEKGNFFTGFVDELRIWNRTLGYSEILNAYHNNSFNTEKQIAYLSFEEYDKNNSSDSQKGQLQLNGIHLNGSIYQDVKDILSRDSIDLKPFHLEKTKTDKPYHSSRAYELSHDHGHMNGFPFAQTYYGRDGRLVVGYYDNREIPHYWKFASEFVLADNFFAPTMGSGVVNHLYLYTAGPVNFQNISSYDFLNSNDNIFEELQERGVSWKFYVEDHDPTFNNINEDVEADGLTNFPPEISMFIDNRTLNSNIVGLAEYFRDLRNNDFPSVAYISAPTFDESSPKDVSVGQEFIASLVYALMKSKHWEDSVFIITYQESGGWYDHASPPKIDGQQYGFRVPTLIISPFAKKGYVDHTIYDVT